MSLREVSKYTDYYNYYAEDQAEYSDWDADKLYGCVCLPGFEGPACDLKSCPRGDDPVSPGQDEVQLLDCQCRGDRGGCTGGLFLLFQGQRTAFLPYNSSAALLRYRLEQLDLVERVAVEVVQGAGLCSPGGSVTKITMLLPVKRWATMSVLPAAGMWGDTIGIRAKGQASHLDRGAVSGARTKEQAACSNRGLCDTSSGVCSCFTGYTSSDGLGGEGSRGDCGYLVKFTTNYHISGTGNHTHSLITPCPYTAGGLCSGHGQCNNATGLCSCGAGYGAFLMCLMAFLVCLLCVSCVYY